MTTSEAPVGTSPSSQHRDRATATNSFSSRPHKRQRRNPSLGARSPDQSSSVVSTSSLAYPTPLIQEISPARRLAHQRGRRTLFAAVAGRSTIRRADADASSLHPQTGAPLTPWESLALTSRRAPERYEEPDLDNYDFQRWLPGRQTYGDDIYEDGLEIDKARMTWLLEEKRSRAFDSNEAYSDEATPVGAGEGTYEDIGSRGASARANGHKFLRDHEAPKAQVRRQSGPPSSDMTKAILRYASSYYHALQATNDDHHDHQHVAANASVESLDETALLAMAILMEETARDIVSREPGPLEHASSNRSQKTTADADEHAGKSGEGWRALMVGMQSGRDPDALDLVDETGMSVIADGGRMRRDRRDWRTRKAVRKGRSGQSENKSSEDSSSPEANRSSKEESDTFDEDVISDSSMQEPDSDADSRRNKSSKPTIERGPSPYGSGANSRKQNDWYWKGADVDSGSGADDDGQLQSASS